MLSIFCPYRNRPVMFTDFIADYSKLYPEAMIYMIEQDDNTPFKRGQLANVMFNELVRTNCPLDNIAFIDNDLRLYDRLDFEGMLNRNQVVTVPFDRIETYEYISVGHYVPSSTKSYFLTGDQITGGITLFSKDMFVQCNGFSNVYVGWGCEDSDFMFRNPKAKHEHNTILHLEHKRKNVNKVLARNLSILQKRRTVPSFDGCVQTTFESVSSVQIRTNVFHYKFKYIGVVSDFKYKNYF